MNSWRRYALDSLQAARISVLYIGDEYGIGLRDGVRCRAETQAAGPRRRDHDSLGELRWSRAAVTSSVP